MNPYPPINLITAIFKYPRGSFNTKYWFKYVTLIHTVDIFIQDYYTKCWFKYVTLIHTVDIFIQAYYTKYWFKYVTLIHTVDIFIQDYYNKCWFKYVTLIHTVDIFIQAVSFLGSIFLTNTPERKTNTALLSVCTTSRNDHIVLIAPIYQTISGTRARLL